MEIEDNLAEELPRTETTTNESLCLAPSKQEVELQMNRLKSETPGEDGIQTEMTKMDETTISKIHELIEMVWEEEKLSEEWNVSLICLIYGYKKTYIKTKIANTVSVSVKISTDLKQG